MAPIYGAHCSVIFVIAHLSCSRCVGYRQITRRQKPPNKHRYNKTPFANHTHCTQQNNQFLPNKTGVLLGRPYVSTGGILFCSWCFFFLTRNLRGPSADRRETLPHDRNLVQFYNAGPKVQEVKNGGQKNGGQNMQNFGRFCTTPDFDREYLRNDAIYPKSDKKLSYCWETVRRESMPRIAEMDVEMTT